jgi:hypothetical protein
MRRKVVALFFLQFGPAHAALQHILFAAALRSPDKKIAK